MYLLILILNLDFCYECFNSMLGDLNILSRCKSYCFFDNYIEK